MSVCKECRNCYWFYVDTNPDLECLGEEQPCKKYVELERLYTCKRCGLQWKTVYSTHEGLLCRCCLLELCAPNLACDKCGSEFEDLDEMFAYDGKYYCENCLLKMFPSQTPFYKKEG